MGRNLAAGCAVVAPRRDSCLHWPLRTHLRRLGVRWDRKPKPLQEVPPLPGQNATRRKPKTAESDLAKQLLHSGLLGRDVGDGNGPLRRFYYLRLLRSLGFSISGPFRLDFSFGRSGASGGFGRHGGRCHSAPDWLSKLRPQGPRRNKRAPSLPQSHPKSDSSTVSLRIAVPAPPLRRIRRDYSCASVDRPSRVWNPFAICRFGARRQSALPLRH